MTKVRWAPLVGHEDHYAISSNGQVRSLYTGRLLKPLTTGARYPYVVLYSGSRTARKNHRVHILVARTFLGPPPEGMEVRHLDGDVTNNRLSNLKYGTSSENKQDSLRLGVNYNKQKTHCPKNHPYDEENTYWYGNNRQCKTCHNERTRKRRHG